MKHTVATFIAGGQQVLTAFAITLAIFLCACGERGEEPPSAAATPAPTGTVEPTPTTEPTLTPTATPAPSPTEQLAFIGVGGDIWLVNADGSGLRKFASDICEGTGGGSAHYLAWSPAGDKLACFCGDPDQRQSTIVLDETGQVLARIEDALFWGGWSPDGRQIAYTSSLELWEAGGEDVRVLDIVSLQDRAIIEGALVLAWPVSGRLLVGIEVPGEPAGELAKYEANWLDLDTGELERVPRLDDAGQFWFSPDGQWAVVLARSQAGVGLAIFDPVTGEEKPIVGSSIGYPGEVIPPYQVAVSPDGSSIYWADAGETPAVIWRARADGSGLTRLGTVPSFFVAVSGHGKVAYLVPGPGGPDSGGTVVIADLERETHTEVSEGFLDLGAAAWRTVTSPSEVTPTSEPTLAPEPTPESAATPIAGWRRWQTLYDGDVTLCVESAPWPDSELEALIEEYWGVEARVSCEHADLTVETPEGWWMEDSVNCAASWPSSDAPGVCEVSLNPWCQIRGETGQYRHDYDGDGRTEETVEDALQKAFLCAFGYCAGFEHTGGDEYRGAMFAPCVYWPSEGDRQALRELYGSGKVGAPVAETFITLIGDGVLAPGEASPPAPTRREGPWQPLHDGEFTFCVESGGWPDAALVIREELPILVENYWGVTATLSESCDGADVLFHLQGISGESCGRAARTSTDCDIQIDVECLEQAELKWGVEAVFEKALLHELGHCFGFGHREDYDGAMHPSGVYWPNEEDRQALKSLYGLD